MEASPPSPAPKPPTGKKKKSDSPAAKAKRMERDRNDEDVQELLMQRDMHWMPQLEEALRNEKDHQRYIRMNAEHRIRLALSLPLPCQPVATGGSFAFPEFDWGSRTEPGPPFPSTLRAAP